MPKAHVLIEIFPWNRNFECGIARIDSQHKRLVELLNELVQCLAFNAAAPELAQIFARLQDYAAHHFSVEEEIWDGTFHADPWAEQHKDSHADFVKKVSDLLVDGQGKPEEEVVEGVVSFLTHWLALHILESDKRMAKAVLARQAGMSVEEAKNFANREMSGAARVLIDTLMGMYDALAQRTVQLTREINRRSRTENKLQAARDHVATLHREALEREAALRSDYEALIGEYQAQSERTEAAMERTIAVLSATLEARDPYTAGHQREVARIAAEIAQRLALGAFQAKGLNLAALVHDIGKIQVPFQILCKPGRLDDLEMAMVRTHSRSGWNILKSLDLPWPIAEIVYQHHEYLDGSGYPRGLSGEQILLEARIITVADIVESMSSSRPYRPALGIDAALDEIVRLRGSKLDPRVVDACVDSFRNGTAAFAVAESDRGQAKG